jgi:hypothetical protein
MKMAMKLEKENVRFILGRFLDDVELWEAEGKAAEKQLAYIAGVRDMANAVMDAIVELGGK